MKNRTKITRPAVGAGLAVAALVPVLGIAAAPAQAAQAAEQGPDVTDPGMPRMTAEMAAMNPIEDDGKRTMMMPAIDLEALGLDPSSSGNVPVASDDEPADNGNGDKPESKSKKKRKRR